MIDPQNELTAVDLRLPAIPERHEVAFIRMDDSLWNFLKRVMEERDIVGFNWNGDRELGILTLPKGAGPVGPIRKAPAV